MPRIEENDGPGNVINGIGAIKICYSEKIDVDIDPAIHIRKRTDEWDVDNIFKPQNACDPVQRFYKVLIGEVMGLIPGAGLTVTWLEEAENCDHGYCEDEGYDCGLPSSADWKNINEYDTYCIPYDLEYGGFIFHPGADKVWAHFPLRFNEHGEYTIHAFFEGYDLGNRKIGKELDWTIKVVE